MTEFPTIVYRVPGPHIGPRCMYAYKGAADEAAFNALLDAGWFATLPEAKAGIAADAIVEAVEAFDVLTDNVSPETREALEARAKALGVSFNWKTSTEVLIERIASA